MTSTSIPVPAPAATPTAAPPEREFEMSRVERLTNLGFVVVPLLAFLAAVVLLWNSLVGPTDLAIMAFMYVITAFGITIGYHRLLTHRAFEAPRPVRYLFAALGSMAVQGPVIDWVADHRKHHVHADEDGDPHSPHGFGGGAKGAFKGLVWAQFGWLFETQGQADRNRYARDLLKDRGIKIIHRGFPLYVLATLALPFGLGYAIQGTLAGALSALLWGGFVRIFLLHHVTWSVNSVCHFFGQRRFDTDDESRNNLWIAIPSLGEGWHHNHHAFPQSAVHGLRRWEIDPSAAIIKAMAKVGLARNVVTISPEKQRAKELPAA